jgi:hypothetical protein
VFDKFSKILYENESFHRISKENGVRVVESATSKNQTLRNTMVPH